MKPHKSKGISKVKYGVETFDVRVFGKFRQTKTQTIKTWASGRRTAHLFGKHWPVQPADSNGERQFVEIGEDHK